MSEQTDELESRINSEFRHWFPMRIALGFTTRDKFEMIVSHYGVMLDKLLNHCPIGECMECGKIVCPHGEPLHLHHDGCPACAMEIPETEGFDHP